MQSLLITRPQYELTTYYLFHWCKPILSMASHTDTKVVDLDGKRANKKELTGILKKISPELILFNGHGTESSILGHDNEELIRVGDNETLLKGRVVYALACSSGKILGPKSIESGTLSYLGYKEDFVFWTNSHYSSRPLEDPRAALFLEASNQIALTLLKGGTTGQAIIAAKQKFLETIRSLVTSNSPDKFLVPYLIWDMQHLVLHGNDVALS